MPIETFKSYSVHRASHLGCPLHRRVVGRRKLEVLARIVGHTLIRLSYSKWTKDLDPDISFTSFKQLAR